VDVTYKREVTVGALVLVASSCSRASCSCSPALESFEAIPVDVCSEISGLKDGDPVRSPA